MTDETPGSPFDSMFRQMFEQSQHAHEREHMHHDEFMVSLYALIESLSNSDLLTMRRILLLERGSAAMNFVDGIVAGYMRYQRKLNPDTGLTLGTGAADLL